MKIRLTFGVTCLLALPLLPCLGEGYFEKISATNTPPSDYYVPVNSVNAKESADRAGMRSGDKIVGIDGLRTRGRKEYMFVRYFYDHRPTISFTLSNAGKLRDITCNDFYPIRRCGFGLDDHVPDFIAKLSVHGVDIASLSDAPKRRSVSATNAPITDLFDSFGLEEARPAFGLQGKLNDFPMRAREAVLAVLDRNDPGDSEWASSLLKVYLLLVQQRYDDARQIVTAKKLADRQVDPFLNRLLKFYTMLIDLPPSKDRPFRLGDYGVDAVFFTLCYPYPPIYDKTGDSFAYDPAFQDLFDKATAANRELFSKEVRQAATRYAKMTSGTDVERYMGVVRAYMLCGAQHPAWQWLQESNVSQADVRKEILADLQQRKSTKKDEAVETAFAILTAAVLDNDVTLAEEAYKTVIDAGAREATLGRRIVAIVVAWQTRNTAMLTACDQVESTMQLPPFYEYLQTVSPVFDFGRNRRCYTGTGSDVVDLREFCIKYPSVVAKALERPLDSTQVQAAVDAALEGDDPAIADKALDLLSEKMAFHYQSEDMDTLFELGRKTGAGKIIDAMMYAMAYHDSAVFSVDSAEMEVQEIDYNYINRVERQYYKVITDKMNSIKNDDPNLPQIAQKYYELAGVPSICLVIAKKLREAGLTDLADGYVRKVRRFHLPNSIPVVTPRKALMQCRDFASIPGFEQEGSDSGPDYAAWANAIAAYTLFAGMDVYRGNVDSAIEYLVKSLKNEKSTTDDVFIYNGVMYSSLYKMRMQVLQDLVTNNKLTDKQIARLREFPSLGADRAMNAARTAGPAKQSSQPAPK